MLLIGGKRVQALFKQTRHAFMVHDIDVMVRVDQDGFKTLHLTTPQYEIHMNYEEFENAIKTRAESLNSARVTGIVAKNIEVERPQKEGDKTTTSFILAVPQKKEEGLPVKRKPGRPKVIKEEKKFAFIRVVTSGILAETCASVLGKDMKVMVEGSLLTKTYKNNQGQELPVTSLNAEHVELLEWQERQVDLEGFIEVREKPFKEEDVPF